MVDSVVLVVVSLIGMVRSAYPMMGGMMGGMGGGGGINMMGGGGAGMMNAGLMNAGGIGMGSGLGVGNSGLMNGGYGGGMMGGGVGGGMVGGGVGGGMNGGLIAPGMMGPGIGGGIGISRSMMGMPMMHHGGYGGEEMAGGAYDKGDKKMNDAYYKQAGGKHGQMYDGGQQGYSKGEMAAKDMKGDQGYYKGQNGAKKMYEDGKLYEGNQHYNKQGKNEGAMKMAKGHKKGHKIKGFKNSSQKQETGKTEEFYDEANDEGDHYMYNGQSGSFGEKAGSAYHGGKQEGKFNHESAGKEGHFNKGYFQDSHKGNSGRYGEKKFSEEGGIYGFNNGAGVTNMAGHDMHKSFFKKHPFYHNYY